MRRQKKWNGSSGLLPLDTIHGNRKCIRIRWFAAAVHTHIHPTHSDASLYFGSGRRQKCMCCLRCYVRMDSKRLNGWDRNDASSQQQQRRRWWWQGYHSSASLFMQYVKIDKRTRFVYQNSNMDANVGRFLETKNTFR